MSSHRVSISFVTLIFFGVLHADAFQYQRQDTTNMPKDWYLRDWQDDHQQGLSVEKTYATLLKDKPSRTVLVAVIDSGVDTDHEDLKDVIWSNEDEVADNGIDDDNNGYIDDVHGWSFIGGKNGSVVEDTYELTREYVRLKGIYGRPGERKARKKNAVEFEYWRKIKQEFEKSSTLYNNLYATFQKRYVDAGLANDTVKKILKVEKLKAEHLSQLNVKGAFLKTATETLAAAFKTFGDVDRALAEWKAIVNFFEYKSKYGYNVGFDPRTIVGDNYSDVYEKNYGSNDVKGPDPDHGTHVAGIIGANRNNNIGIKGIANNIRIMVLRAVPHGDERDKDVANAIIYAVDNGAKVINMSFGKYYSPQKDAVDKSVKYAESKDVLIIHAAGNDRTDNDIHGSFPSRYYLDGSEAQTWLEVGATSWRSDLVAPFSNYGKKSVDFFAPGVAIYSTTPGNTYNLHNGTSMACPAAVGVAAMLLSYFPELTAVQVKDILRQSARKLSDIVVNKPGTAIKLLFADLSSTGGLLNAYEAVKTAMTVKMGAGAK